MRIQHNIMAMSAYRNYTNNVSAMKKNLEKLSSGYKINRAGDDAAGLAISEKMRAQITGLETAQKNAKDGISLVQTAEGALTEVHDMLNRMVELATQSANGTYDNTTDRAQMQKELDQLKSEINRIADSSNFNGIKLLDGSMDSEVHNTVSELTRFNVKAGTLPTAGTVLGTNTVLHADAGTGATVGFSIDLHDVAFTNKTGQTLTINVGGTTITVTGTVAASAATTANVLSGASLVSAIYNAVTTGTDKEIKIGGQTFTVSIGEGGSNRLDFRLKGSGDGSGFKGAAVTVSGDGLIAAGTERVDATPQFANSGAAGTSAVTITADNAINFGATPSALKGALDGKTVTLKVGGVDFAVTIDSTATVSTATTVAIGDYTANTGTSDLWDRIVSSVNQQITAKNRENAAGTGNYTEIGQIGNTVTAPTGVIGANTATAATGTVTTQAKKMGTAGLTGQPVADYNVATTDIINPNNDGQKRLASTYFDLTADMVKDGGSVTIGKTEYVFTTEAGKTGSGDTKYVDITEAMKGGVLNLSRAAQLLTEAAADNSTYTVGHKGTDNGRIYVTEIEGQTDFAENNKSTLNTVEGIEKSLGFKTVSSTKVQEGASALTLQIGDTAEDFNQLKVNIRDMHVASLGLDKISIADQDSASTAVAAIKNAINLVSDVRGTLGATQNRLDHTINNLSVMTENIQDAESTIRDVDVAEEMMAYTKNNILIQSAQAMLAQANQVPQGVLQLLQ